MNTRIHHCWSLKIWKKNNYSPNDQFLIELFSRRVPPMSTCPPFNNNQRVPLLINPFQGGIYLGGKLRKTWQGPSDLVGGVINPVLPLPWNIIILGGQIMLNHVKSVYILSLGRCLWTQHHPQRILQAVPTRSGRTGWAICYRENVKVEGPSGACWRRTWWK